MLGMRLVYRLPLELVTRNSANRIRLAHYRVAKDQNQDDSGVSSPSNNKALNFAGDGRAHLANRTTMGLSVMGPSRLVTYL